MRYWTETIEESAGCRSPISRSHLLLILRTFNDFCKAAGGALLIVPGLFWQSSVRGEVEHLCRYNVKRPTC